VTPDLRETIWHDCGLVRDAAGLGRLREAPYLLARLTAECALVREESRGAHFRADFPVEDEAFEGHVLLRRGDRPMLETWL
jgi:L-aspartate oxidase